MFNNMISTIPAYVQHLMVAVNIKALLIMIISKKSVCANDYLLTCLTTEEWQWRLIAGTLIMVTDVLLTSYEWSWQ